jgi:hypothetical protein
LLAKLPPELSTLLETIMATAPTPTTNFVNQLIALFVKDEKTATMPDLINLVTYVSQNGITLAGLPQLGKFLTAVEADAIAGGQQFSKDAAALILAWVQAQTQPAS